MSVAFRTTACEQVSSGMDQRRVRSVLTMGAMWLMRTTAALSDERRHEGCTSVNAPSTESHELNGQQRSATTDRSTTLLTCSKQSDSSSSENECAVIS